MRDRRNTNLSTSSTESADSAPTKPGRSSLNEKRQPSPALLSPGLPAPLTKENRPKPSRRRKIAIKGLAAGLVVLLIWRYFSRWWTLPFPVQFPSVPDHVDADTELEGGDDLPDEPTAFMTSTSDGTSKWTLSIPHHHHFPLGAHHYREMCSSGAGLRSAIMSSNRRHVAKHWFDKHGSTTRDSTFLDIDEAQRAGILPKPEQERLSSTCDRSLTFVLESEETSLGKSLLLLWLSYGLAKREGRAFFLDDTRWAWGNYASYFAPAPLPSCTRPPPHQIVPCPHNAKHLVVSSATAAWTFGPAFQREFHAPRQRTQSRIYDLLRSGYNDLFRLIGEDAVYVAERIAKVRSDALKQQDVVVGVQVRRGDQHPFEFQYSRDYLPLDRYADEARALKSSLGSALDGEKEGSLLLASDDPDIFVSSDLQQAAAPLSLQRSQDRIQLATKAALDESSPRVQHASEPGSAYWKYVEEHSGWEGGFYSALFHSMGGAKAIASSSQSSGSGTNVAIPEQALRLRELVGRAFLMEMAILGSADGVVCAISSASCRMLGVMMGWDAVREGRWRNIDDGRAWSWDGHRR